jgi:hypothetical protein
MDQDKSKETPEEASPSGSEQKTAEIIDNDGKKGEGAVTDELGIEPKLEDGPHIKLTTEVGSPVLKLPEGSEEEVKKPETAGEVLQLIQDKIKQKLYSKMLLEEFVEDPHSAIRKECDKHQLPFVPLVDDIKEIICAAYFQQLIINASGGQKLNNEVLANKVTNDILLKVEIGIEEHDITTLEYAHLLHALKEVK